MRRAGGEQRHDLEGKPCQEKGRCVLGDGDFFFFFKASPKEEELKRRRGEKKKGEKEKKKAGVLELKLR